VSSRYLARRLCVFLLVIWAAATINFVAPRLGGGDPMLAKLGQLAATGGLQQQDVDEMVAAYRAQFGLERPLAAQYASYLWNTLRLDFGQSLAKFPARVDALVARAMPWTIVLLTVATLVSFALGTLAGAALAWPTSSRGLRAAIVPFAALSAVPYYIVGLLAVYAFGLKMRLFPVSGGFDPVAVTGGTLGSALDVAYHSVLPACTLVACTLGHWALSMQGAMAHTVDEQFVEFAVTTGIRPRTIFFRCAMRNALLPQLTTLGLSLGQLVSGAILLEVVFAYPGVGTLLFEAISSSDYTLIHGIVFVTVLSVALAGLVLDLIYPLVDPRVDRGGSA
jgi:peptide/nickel transport system permease protein